MRQARGFRVVILSALIVLVALPAAHAGKTQKRRLDNGVTVIAKPAEWNRIVAISVTVAAGSKYDPSNLSGVAHLTNNLLLEGTTGKSALELADILDRHGIVLGSYVTEDFSGLHATCIDEHADLALEVLAEILTSPALDATRLLEVQKRTLDDIEEGEVDPGRKNDRRLRKLLFAEHPYSRPPTGTLAGAGRASREDVVEFYDTYYVGESTTIAIVGNFCADRAFEALADLLSEYPRGRVKRPRSPDVRRDESTADEIYMDVPEAHVSIGYLTPPADDKDYAAISVLASIIDSRADAGLSAAPGSEGAEVALEVSALCYCAAEHSAIRISLTTLGVDRALEIVEAETDRLRTESISPDELSIAKNALKGRAVLKGQTNLVRAVRLSLDYAAGFGIDADDARLEKITRVSEEDVLKVARRYLVNPAIAIIRPGRPTSPASPERPSKVGI